jgi:sigma-B regulation protein RsbU (phosphoserine phosphatase)
MREKVYFVGFLLAAIVLLYLGHDLFRGSVLVSWGLSFAGTTTAGVVALTLYRFKLQLEASRDELRRKEAELSFALKVQQALFPRELPSSGGIEFSAVCIPASGVSGDYYDVFELPDGRIVMAIADISGKGISAAILMANVQALLRVVAGTCDSPGTVCGKLNAHLHRVTHADWFATLFYAEWYPSKRLLRYCNAGHHTPFLSTDSTNRPLNRGGIPLGILPEYEFETGEATLHPGDLVVMYSDGITEAGARDKGDFGETRLLTLVAANRQKPLRRIQEQVLEEVHAWTGEEVEDDITLVLARVSQA